MENNTLLANNGAGRIKKFITSYALYLFVIALFLVYAFLTPLFLSGQNIISLLTNSAPLLVAAVGITLILIVGEIDLSIGSTAAVTASLWILMLTEFEIHIALATIIALIVSMLIGVINATLIVRLGINSFLVTIGMQMFLRGFVFIFTGGSQILMTDAVNQTMAAMRNFFQGLSPLLVFGILIAVIMMLVYRYTSFGRKVQAVGCNQTASDKLGINVKATKSGCFMLSALLAGFAGIMMAINVGMVHPANIGTGLEFLAITAVVLGGTSLFGGIGTIIPGTLVGVIFVNSIENGLGLLGANAHSFPVVRGLVIYLAMLTDSFRYSLSSKK